MAELIPERISMPGKGRGGNGARGSQVWTTKRAELFGQYPAGFTAWACRQIRVQPDRVLHLCSGALLEGQGIRIDRRWEVGPDIVADAQTLPFADNSFPAALIDPPYSDEYAKNLYGTSFPSSKALLREAARVVKPGGRIGFLHHVHPFAVEHAEYISTTGIYRGPGYAMCCFVIFEVERQRALFA